MSPEFIVHEEGILRFQNRLCVPNRIELKEKILTEAHNIRFSLNRGRIILYRDLKQYFGGAI